MRVGDDRRDGTDVNIIKITIERKRALLYQGAFRKLMDEK